MLGADAIIHLAAARRARAPSDRHTPAPLGAESGRKDTVNVKHCSAAALAALALVTPTTAVAGNVSIFDSLREIYAQENAVSFGETTLAQGAWSETVSTGQVGASQTSDIQEDLFAVTGDLSVDFDAPQETPNALAYSHLFVTFDVVGQSTQFAWNVELMQFTGMNDSRVGAGFALDEFEGDSVFITYREWVSGDPKPATISDTGGTVVLSPGRYSFGMYVFGNGDGASTADVFLNGSFYEIPAPAAFALLSVAGLAGARRRR